jgi:hypothetical protein
MRRRMRGNVFWLRSGAADYRVMLIPFVQGIVGSLDKDYSPLDEGSGEESRDRTENHFLEKSSVHPIKNSIHDASDAFFTKIPTASFS